VPDAHTVLVDTFVEGLNIVTVFLKFVIRRSCLYNDVNDKSREKRGFLWGVSSVKGPFCRQ
jgi:hypothetical protein